MNNVKITISNKKIYYPKNQAHTSFSQWKFQKKSKNSIYFLIKNELRFENKIGYICLLKIG